MRISDWSSDVCSSDLNISLTGYKDIPAVLLCGVVGGFLGGIFSRILLFVLGGPGGRLGSFIRQHPIAFAALCGLGTAICGILSGNHTYATGYDEARPILPGSGTNRTSAGKGKKVS